MKLHHSILALVSLGLASQVSAVVVMNEYNAVRSDRWLDADGFGASTASDSYFGRIAGNGGRWFEAIVVGNTTVAGETIDMRGWTFNWTSGDVGFGSFTLTTDAALAAIHRGTLLTFFSQDAGGPNVATNMSSYDPGTNNWWLNINLTDAQFIASGTLNTGNDNWQLTIQDASSNTIFGPAGEGIGTFGGVSSREVAKLEETHATIAGWQGVTPTSNYKDGTSSTFGEENAWSSGSNVQDLTALRNIPEPSTALLGVLGMLAMARRRR
jgi:hypothetical protein